MSYQSALRHIVSMHVTLLQSLQWVHVRVCTVVKGERLSVCGYNSPLPMGIMLGSSPKNRKRVFRSTLYSGPANQTIT